MKEGAPFQPCTLRLEWEISDSGENRHSSKPAVLRQAP